MDDDSALAADPRDNGWPVLVIMPPPRFTFLAAATRAAPQRLLAPALRLALLAGGVIELVRFHRALQPALGLVGHGTITEPPAPTIAGPAMNPQLSGNPSRRT